MKTFAAVLWIATAASATTLQIEPVATTIIGAGSADVSVRILDVSDLYAYQFDVGYSGVIPESITEGPFLQTGGGTFFFSSFFSSGGRGGLTITDTLIGPIAGVSGSGTLATIRFSGRRGNLRGAPVTLTNVILLNSASGSIIPVVENGSLTVVPEGGSGLLISSGLSGILLWRYRPRRNIHHL